MQRQYPELPTSIAEQLLANAKKSELDTLADQQRIPLDLKGRARECAFETRGTRAYEGFYQDERLTPDTERLALNVLRLYSDTYNNLRIEIRYGTVDGTLRCSVGPDDAANVRILLRDDQGRYEVRDGDHRKLFEAGDLYESLLRSMPEGPRRVLGYRPGEGNDFKEWLMAKTQAPAERRTLLLKPSIRPVADPETNLLLRGPALSSQAKTLEQRVKDMYPHFSEREVDTFVRSLPTAADSAQLVTALEDQLIELRDTLDAWQVQNARIMPDDMPSFVPMEVMHISERLLECFQRKSRVFDERSTRLEGGYALDLSSEMRSYNLERWWKKLPDMRKYLDQISTLNLDNMRFSEGSGGMLKDFTQLRQFSARHAELTRLPDGVGKMSMLETLRLSDNRIELTPEAVEQLRNLTRMQTLRLDHNPLGRVPEVGRMPRLKILSLAHTGIDTWPEGLLRKHRPRGFFLDLQGNPIKTIPTTNPGPGEALIVGRARLDAENLLDTHQQALFDLRESVGLPRQNAYAPLAKNARGKWPMSDDSSLWGNHSPGLGAYRDEAWDNLMSEPNSEGFFKVLDLLTTSADYQAAGPTRELLSRRVWDLVDAMDLDTPLRETLFRTAETPETCGDGGSEIFNNMGVQALVSEAYSYSTFAEELETRLVPLGKGVARLHQVNEIAKTDVQSRPTRNEEVEIYLAYQTRLAKRLDLPWQSDKMLFEGVAGVSDSAIDQAYETVIDLEKGDGLVNGMLQQPFWEKYLYEKYPDKLYANDLDYDQQLDLLEDQRDEQTYSGLVSDLAYKRLELSRELTRTLLAKHGL